MNYSKPKFLAIKNEKNLSSNSRIDIDSRCNYAMWRCNIKERKS